MGRHDCFVNEIVGGNEDVKYKIRDETVIDNVDYGKLFEVHFSSMNDLLIVCAICSSLKVYYVGMNYMCFPMKA